MRIQVVNYTFNKTAKTVTFTDYGSIVLANILSIVNVTRNVIIYNPLSTATGGSVATNVLTLTFDTSAQADADKLQIFYENGILGATATALPVSGTLTTTPPANASTNITQLAGTAIDVNSGTKSAGTQRFVIATDQPQLTNALKVDGSAVTQPVSGTVTTTPPANASTNLAQVAGTTADTNSGNKSAGTLRVVLATDQPALTNKLLVTPDLPSGASTAAKQPALGTAGAASADVITVQGIASMTALKVDGSAVTQPVSGTVTTTPPSNASTNVAQFGGTNVSTGTGTGGAGIPRVTISSDSSLAANQSVNLNQVGGATIVEGRAAAASSLPVVLSNEDVQDLYVTGQSAQTATVNNILTASAGAAATDVQNYRAFAVQVVSTGSGGTFIFEGSNDNTNFQAIPVINQGLAPSFINTAITASSSQIIYVGSCTFRYIRLRIATTITGGSIQAFSTFTQTPYAQTILGVITNSGTSTIGVGSITTSVVPGTAATNLGKAEDAVASSGDTGLFMLNVRRDAPVVSANANGDYNEVAVNKWGAQLTASYEKTAKTYRCSAVITVAATATDIAILPGNATNTAYVTRVTVSGIQTTAGSGLVKLIKRSTANSGGTSGAITAVPLDSGDSAAVSAPLSYTANPTPGTAVGDIANSYIVVGSGTTVSSVATFDFADKGKPVTLSGTAQGLAINLNSVTFTGGSFAVAYEWYEI